MKHSCCVAVAAAVVLLLVGGSASASAEKSPYNYDVAMRVRNYCRATSCTASSILDWSCGSICTAVPSFNPYSILENTTMDAFGFTGVDQTNKQVVVTFRGSSSLTNWLEDFTFIYTPYYNSSTCGGKCMVHEGFHNVYDSVRAQVSSAVTTLLSVFPGYEVLVAGHSLGGALAVLAAVDLQEQLGKTGSASTVVSLYTLGAPRVGNPTFAAWTSSLLANGAHYRITHRRDPVPHLPLMSFGYLHSPTEIFYETDDNSSMRVCAGTATAEDETCSDDMLAVVIKDHLEYLGDCTDCSCPGCDHPNLDLLNDPATSTETPRLPFNLYVRLTLEFLKHKRGVQASN